MMSDLLNIIFLVFVSSSVFRFGAFTSANQVTNGLNTFSPYPNQFTVPIDQINDPHTAQIKSNEKFSLTKLKEDFHLFVSIPE